MPPQFEEIAQEHSSKETKSIKLVLEEEKILLDEKILNYENIQNELEALSSENPDVLIKISRKEDISYEKVLNVIDMITKLDLKCEIVNKED